jgi:DNA-binding Lrp family transcriptional regulator
VDERIMDALREDPRATSKALALQLSMTEVAVASRIKAMEAKGIMRVVAQLEFRALGYNVLALIDVMVAGRTIRDVADELALIDGVGSVTIMLGHPPIIIQVQASDLAALERLILNEIAIIPGIEQIETNVILDIAKWQSGSAQLHPMPPKKG